MQSKPLFHLQSLKSDPLQLREAIVGLLDKRSRKASSKAIGAFVLKDGISAQFWNPNFVN